MIVKLQRPLMSNEKHPPWMCYSQHRDFEAFIDEADIPNGIKKAMRSDLKGYFNATLDSAGHLKFGERVKAQAW